MKFTYHRNVYRKKNEFIIVGTQILRKKSILLSQQKVCLTRLYSWVRWKKIRLNSWAGSSKFGML